MKRIRRSMLIFPGGVPRFTDKALASEADAVVFDLEDAVEVGSKVEARGWVRTALLERDFGRKERCVRINDLSTEFGHEDILAIVEGRPDTLMLPKVNSPYDVLAVDAVITAAERMAGLAVGSVGLMAIIETAEGVDNVMRSAVSSKRLTALGFGAGDFTRETHGVITKSRAELYYAMSRIVCAARVAGIDAIDSPCINVRDQSANEREAIQALDMGYDGKIAIHPDQLETINRIYTPSADKVRFWVRAVEAYRESRGATTVDGQLVDWAQIEMAARVLGTAELVGLLNEDEKEKLEWARAALTSWNSSRSR